MKLGRLLFAVAFLFCTMQANATAPALTAVSATLQDSSTQVWSLASWQTTFIPPFGNPAVPNNNGNPITAGQSGLADTFGHFTVTLDDNNVVAPAGTKWKFTICPNASVTACAEVQMTITGASMDISAALNAALIVPVVNGQPSIARAYNDTEVSGSFGALYLNTITNGLSQCQLSFCSGTGWVGISVPTLNPIFTGTLTVPCVKFNFSVANDTTVCSQNGTGHISVLLPATAGTLGFGTVIGTGTPLNHQLPIWTDDTHQKGITPDTAGFVLTSNGPGADPSFQATSGGGNVSNSGTPNNHEVAVWTDSTHIQGITPSTSGLCFKSNGTSADPSFQDCAASTFPVQTGTLHQLVFNNTTTVGTNDGNTLPAGLWSTLGGTFTVGSNVAGIGSPAVYNLKTSGGLANASASLAEDAVAQQANFGIWQAYSCYCEAETGGGHIVWMAMSSVLYASTVTDHPNGTIWGFRYSGQAPDTNWQAYVATSNANFTLVDTGVPVAPQAMHGFAMNKNSAGGIDYYIDNVKVATISSGATGFPAANTNVYAITESGLLINSVNLSLFIQSVRWWLTY